MLNQVSERAEDHDENIFVKFEPPLSVQRYQYAYDVLFKDDSRIIKMADFGCAEGRLFRHLKKLPFVEEINLIDILKSELEDAIYHCSPIAWDMIFGRFVELTLNIYQGSVIEPDSRLIGLDAITMIELIEHLDPVTLSELPSNIFGYLQPRIVIISTPNVEYNIHFPQLRDGKFRHWDHKFEWSREQFKLWCSSVADQYGYTITYDGVGKHSQANESVGFCSQIAVFRKNSTLITTEVTNVENYHLLQSYTFPKRSNAVEKRIDNVEIDWDIVLGKTSSAGEESIKTE